MPLAPKEGVALLNSGAFSTSLAALALADATRLADALDVAGALDLEAFAANLTILHPRVAETRPYPGLVATRGAAAELLAGSYLWEEGAARNLQDPAHLPLHPADARRAPRRARVRPARRRRSS